jgi:tRNA G26 N,N-dimethylase Trm1
MLNENHYCDECQGNFLIDVGGGRKEKCKKCSEILARSNPAQISFKEFSMQNPQLIEKARIEAEKQQQEKEDKELLKKVKK